MRFGHVVRSPAVEDGGGPDPATGGLSREEVNWGFRLLAGREPMSHAELLSFQALPNLDAMRRAFTNTTDFHAFFDSVLTGFPAWTAPLFLLRPPAAPGLDWRFQPPNLDAPVSQFCTAAQYADPAFAEITEAMGLGASTARHLWEQVWIVSMLATAGLVGAGRTGLGIDTRRERIGALLASRGVAVHATGSAVVDDRAAEHRRLQLFYPEIVKLEAFDALVRFTGLEPRALGTMAAGGHDFCWSIGLPGRLGSIGATLEAIEASLLPLRPGGLALHCFRVNLTSDERSWELPDLTLLRRRDIEAVLHRLAEAGHQPLPFNTHPGHDPDDERVTVPTGTHFGHRQRHGFAVSAAFGLAIRKRG